MPDKDKNNSFWRTAVENYYSQVFNAVYFMTNDTYFAEDITQETFAKAIAKFHQLKNADRFLPWLLSIALNLAKTRVKRDQKIMRVPNIDRFASLIEDNTPLEEAQLTELQEVVNKSILKLSPQEQKVITLKYHLDLNEKDTAFILGISTGSVKKHLYRARLKLHQDLLNWNSEEGDKVERKRS